MPVNQTAFLILITNCFLFNRSKIGVVPQDTVLFNDTLGYNIGYGDIKGKCVTVEIRNISFNGDF